MSYGRVGCKQDARTFRIDSPSHELLFSVASARNVQTIRTHAKECSFKIFLSASLLLKKGAEDLPLEYILLWIPPCIAWAMVASNISQLRHLQYF